MQKHELKIKGMHCASCAQDISAVLNKNEYIQNADTNFVAKKAVFEYNAKKIKLNDIKKIVRSIGYSVDGDKADINNNDKKLALKASLAIFLSLPMLVRMFWPWELPGEFLDVSHTGWLQFALTTFVVFFLGIDFHRNALKALGRAQTNMDTLVSLGTLAAYFFSAYAMTRGEHLYFESAATITALILLGRYLETKTKTKPARQWKNFWKSAPKQPL